MHTFELISLVINLVFGTGFIATFITLKQTKQKAKSDVEKSNIELATASVSEMLQSVNSLMSQNNDLVNKLSAKNLENCELVRRVELLERKVANMQRINRDVLKAIEKLPIDESLLKNLMEHTK